MTEHFTKGPWRLDPRASMTIQSVEGRGIASVSYSSTVNPDAVYEANQANAHLIAAAPELYDALVLAMTWIENWDPNFTEDDEWREESCPQIEAALAKARGEQNG